MLRLRPVPSSQTSEHHRSKKCRTVDLVSASSTGPRPGPRRRGRLPVPPEPSVVPNLRRWDWGGCDGRVQSYLLRYLDPYRDSGPELFRVRTPSGFGSNAEGPWWRGRHWRMHFAEVDRSPTGFPNDGHMCWNNPLSLIINGASPPPINKNPN